MIADFDAFFEEGYDKDEAPQAFADWLAALLGDKVIGFGDGGVVEGSS